MELNKNDYFASSYEGKNSFAYYLLGALLVLIVGQIIGSIPLGLAISQSDSGFSSITNGIDFKELGIPSSIGLMLLIFAFFVSLVLLIWFVNRIQKKSFFHYFGPDKRVDWGRFFFGFIVWFILIGLTQIYSYYSNPEEFEVIFNMRKFLPLVFVALLFFPIQTSFEEFFFRGFLMQGWFITMREWFGIKNYAKIGAVIATSILFALLHSANPEVMQFGFFTMMSYYFVMGLTLGLLVLFDNRIELALGLHAANNIFGATVVSVEGGVIMTDSILRAEMSDPSYLAIGVLFYSLIFIGVCFYKFRWNLSTILFDPIQNKKSEYA